MSFTLNDYFREKRALLSLALPLMGAQLVMVLAGCVDTVMAGQYSSIDLAAVAVAYTTWIPVNVFLVGLMMGKTAFVAHLVGADRHEDVPDLVHQGLRLALLAGVAGLVVLYFSPWLLEYTGMSDQSRTIATGYLHAVAWGMPGVAINQVLRSYMEGQGYTRSVMVIQVVSLAFNVPFNYAMIYGKFGFPEMGGVGCGYATALIMWMAPLLMALYIKLDRSLHRTTPWRKPAKINYDKIRQLVAVGLPIGSTLFVQFLVFTAITLMVTPLGETVVGAHQIAFNISTVPFVIPSAIGGASTILIGQALGAGDREHARFRGWVGAMTCLMICLLMAVLIWAGASVIVRLYSSDVSAVELAEKLVLYVVVYHVFSGLQQVSASSLRGYKDTRRVMVIMLFCLWGIAVPVGFVLGRTDWLVAPMGASGFWTGIVMAFAVAAVLTQIRLHRISR